MAYKFLAIKDLAQAGLNSDIQPWDLPPNYLTEMRNIRLRRNQLAPFGGTTKWADLPVDFDPGLIMPVNTPAVGYWLVAGVPGVRVYDAASFSDISSGPYAGVSDPDLWSGCMLSRIPIINHPSWYPEYWSPQQITQPLQPLPWNSTQTWDDASQQCKIIRSHKQFLMALNLVDNGVELPDWVAWSTPADIGGVPESWDYLDNTVVAARVPLGGDGGDIVDGLSLRDAFCVYRESGISVMDFVPESSYVFQIRNLSTTVGLISTESIAEVEGNHLFIGDGDILINDGNRINSLIHDRIRKRFVSNYNPDSYQNSYVVVHKAANEVWFCVPEAGEDYPTICYIYNWRDNSWSIRDLPSMPHANYGEVSTPPLTWDNIPGSWDVSALTWQSRQATPLDDTPIGCTKPAGAGQSGELLLLDRSAAEIDSPFDSVIERVGIPLEGLNRVTTITRVYPRMTGPGSVDIQIGSQDYPGAPVRWKPIVSFDPDTDRFINMRTTGELHCFRISSPDTMAGWDISGLDIEYVDAGSR